MINICNVLREGIFINILDIDLKLNTKKIKDFIRGYVVKLKKDGAVVDLAAVLILQLF